MGANTVTLTFTDINGNSALNNQKTIKKHAKKMQLQFY
jgi:hypothetical protein